ncbi:MAG: T9SS type A sorting domain-containing protein [Chlorobi bacterium]|nr:T9SS type A sorting domain-containing protein [Chlorobiota bacterium]MCI0715684.1 T9SS type A sorting domain-containing protein [Chlorobiota bacterium]
MKKEKHHLIPVKSVSFILFFVVLLQSEVFAQEGENDGSWFFRDRAYPYDTIPVTSMVNALEYAKEITDEYGYALPAPLQWTSIGPRPYFYGGNPLAGRVACVRYYPNVPGFTQHPDWVYIAGHGGGVWKSTDGGANFNPITDALESQTSGSLAFDPNNPNILYYGTGGNVSNFQFNYYGIGVYKSTDAGQTWNGPYRTGFLRNHIQTYKIAVNPANSNHVYLACGTDPFYYPPNGDGGGGLYKSTDGGITWAIAPGTPPHKACNDVVIYYDFESQTNRIYAVGRDGEGNFGYRISINGGANFVLHNDGVFKQGGRTHLAIPSMTSNKIYAVSAFGCYSPDNNRRGVYGFVSNNGGFNFTFTRILTEACNPPCACTTATIDLFAATDFMFVNSSPHNSQTAIVGFGTYFLGGGLYRTTNGGANYQAIYPPGADQNNLDFNPYSGYENDVILGDDQGLYKSTNLGSTWTYLNNSLSLTECYRVAASPNDQNLFISVTDAGYFKKQSGTTWIETHFGRDGTQMVASKYNSNVFLGNKGCICNNPAHMSFTTNAGSTWQDRAINWGFWDYQDWIAPITQLPDQNNPGTFYHPRRRGSDNKLIDINVSFDNGNSWNQNPNNIAAINSGFEWTSPQMLTFVESNPQIIYVSVKSVDFFHPGTYASDLYKSTNGGENWTKLPIHNYVPNRVITCVATDPQPGYENMVYITFSGFAANTPSNIGHVFQSNDGGNTWIDISSWPMSPYSMPDLPVNYMIVRRISATQKQLIISTDAGVYNVVEGGWGIYHRWQPLAGLLPNAVALGMHYNEATMKLRVATFGRGVYEVNLQGPIYVSRELVLFGDGDGLNVGDDIIVGPNATLKIPNSAIIKMPAGKKIIVQSGGQIDASTGNAITFASQSGEWGGIEFEDEGAGTLKNCTFQNTSTPIVIEDQSGSADPPDIVIDGCTFNAPVQITNRHNVTVSYCNFSYISGTVPSVLGVMCSGSNDVLITNNSIISNSSITSVGISVVYGSNVVVQKNNINNMSVGISISNSSPFIWQNRITNNTSSSAVVGIGLDNSYSATLKQNAVIGFQIGYKMYSSSPLMYQDSSYNTNTSGDSVNGVHAVYNSNPRIKPDDSGIEIIWDGGKNNFKNTAKGNGIFMWISSVPDLDYGYNYIYGYDNYLFGDGPDITTYYVRCNDWVDDPPNSSKFNLSNPGSIEYTPYGCTPPGGSGMSSKIENLNPKPEIFELRSEIPDPDPEEGDNPPQPIIINYGHGVYDTIKVTSGTFESTADQKLYSQAAKEELLGNYQTAISKFEGVIESYQDSAISINAMKKILHCHQKMNSDTGAYSNLRSYYLSLAQSNSSDTAFVKVAKELATKTLVRKGDLEGAITEYENVVTSSNDPHEVFCSELNIIETYIIMSQQGDAPAFTGRLAHLKPQNSRDGHNRLLEKLYNIKPTEKTVSIPTVFSLSQNYPNPFNPLTKIKFGLPKDSKVNLVIYDILGREVIRLVNKEFKSAGTHVVEFNGSNYASGVYFYRIEVEGADGKKFVDSKKMVLVK